LEKELKFGGVELERLRERLLELEAERLRAPTLEDNLLFDRDGELGRQGALLRLRKDGHGARLTFKGPLRLEGNLRIREEHETEVGDAATARILFESLGYTANRRYQKMREEWRLGGVTIALDHTPIGDFAEFEGEGAETVARRCGLDPDTGERRSYLRLYDDYLAEHPEAPRDMLFS
jgi:adenylate cyclase class 2